MRIGVDIGNVIIGGGGQDTSFFTEGYLATPEVEGAYESLLALEHHELHLISKCGKIVEDKSMVWLFEHGYYWMIKQQNVHFVRKRPLKAPMCQALQIEIFIDDRQDIVDSLEGIVKHPILFTSWEETNKELERIFAETAEG